MNSTLLTTKLQVLPPKSEWRAIVENGIARGWLKLPQEEENMQRLLAKIRGEGGKGAL